MNTKRMTKEDLFKQDGSINFHIVYDREYDINSTINKKSTETKVPYLTEEGNEINVVWGGVDWFVNQSGLYDLELLEKSAEYDRNSAYTNYMFGGGIDMSPIDVIEYKGDICSDKSLHHIDYIFKKKIYKEMSLKEVQYFKNTKLYLLWLKYVDTNKLNEPSDILPEYPFIDGILKNERHIEIALNKINFFRDNMDYSSKTIAYILKSFPVLNNHPTIVKILNTEGWNYSIKRNICSEMLLMKAELDLIKKIL